MIDWILKRNKFLKKIFSKIKKNITELTSQSLNNRVLIEKNKKDLIELKEMIKVREQTLSSPRTKVREPTRYHKKAKKIADKVQLISEIKNLLDKGLSTGEAYEFIVEDKRLCGKTCFYKFLKLVREQALSSPRTKVREPLIKS